MNSGIQVFNEDGSLQFDSSSRLLRSVMMVETGTSNGSKTIAGLTDAGTPLAIIIGSLSGQEPSVTFSGSVMKWTFNASNKYNKSVTVLVTIY